MPLSPEQYADLTDAEKDAAVARACGWTCVGGYWSRPGRAEVLHSPPGHATAGDGDPFARWDLVADMVAFARAAPGVVEIEIAFNRHQAGVGVAIAWKGGEPDEIGTRECRVRGPSPHRALGAALAAAGLLEAPDAQEPQEAP